MSESSNKSTTTPNNTAVALTTPVVASSTHVQPADIATAAARLKPYIYQTPCLINPWLSAQAARPVVVKWESLQLTGSFKLRGALNKLLQLQARGINEVLAVSAGNHGLGVAHAAKLLAMRATIVVPQTAVRTKVMAIQNYGVELIIHGETYEAAEIFAHQLAAARQCTFVSPYNDPDIVAGQGTVLLEMLQDQQFDTILVAAGGGGLLAGVALAAQLVAPQIAIYGVQPLNSQALRTAWQVGQIVPVSEDPTIADGLAGNLDLDNLTLPIIRQYVKDIVTVTEAEIREAIFRHLAEDHLVVEGSGAVTAAAVLAGKFPNTSKNLAIIASGRNINVELLAAIVQENLSGNSSN
jgi:threonine dehydratase